MSYVKKNKNYRLKSIPNEFSELNENPNFIK